MLAVQDPLGLDPGILSLVQFGPLLGAVVTWLICRGRLTRRLPGPIGPGAFARAVAVAFAVSAVFAAATWGMAVLRDQPIAGAHAIAGMPFVAVVLFQLAGAFGEEAGWRGVLQPLLESRFSVTMAAVLTGLIWGAWHIQIFSDLVVTGLFLLGTVALSVAMAFVGRGSMGQRAVVGTVVHWLVNLAALVVDGEGTGSRGASLGMAVAAVAVAAVAVTVGRGRGLDTDRRDESGKRLSRAASS